MTVPLVQLRCLIAHCIVCTTVVLYMSKFTYQSFQYWNINKEDVALSALNPARVGRFCLKDTQILLRRLAPKTKRLSRLVPTTTKEAHLTSYHPRITDSLSYTSRLGTCMATGYFGWNSLSTSPCSSDVSTSWVKPLTFANG